ncbi:hypothetical protein BOX15_Mlig033248g3 [Macrostomum lignano]|uniref:Uncharacterized protein n=1 Tax=Macrostomum lignano TaxID=282301 RepID=A0A267E1J1_9PLAT|nr:hypothetical protein BOX15_Mlig033248g3 [Macrostomum lignano]
MYHCQQRLTIHSAIIRFRSNSTAMQDSFDNQSTTPTRANKGLSTELPALIQHLQEPSTEAVLTNITGESSFQRPNTRSADKPVIVLATPSHHIRSFRPISCAPSVLPSRRATARRRPPP